MKTISRIVSLPILITLMFSFSACSTGEPLSNVQTHDYAPQPGYVSDDYAPQPGYVSEPKAAQDSKHCRALQQYIDADPGNIESGQYMDGGWGRIAPKLSHALVENIRMAGGDEEAVYWAMMKESLDLTLNLIARSDDSVNQTEAIKRRLGEEISSSFSPYIAARDSFLRNKAVQKHFSVCQLKAPEPSSY